MTKRNNTIFNLKVIDERDVELDIKKAPIANLPHIVDKYFGKRGGRR